jgi:hypothetical protein
MLNGDATGLHEEAGKTSLDQSIVGATAHTLGGCALQKDHRRFVA